MMHIIPAIDLKDGLCVRLFQGDYAQATVYGTDPAQVARRWAIEGATRLHVVDLDGAKVGSPVNIGAIQSIVEAVDIPVQLGGGLRQVADIAAAFDWGVERVILGTAAVQEPDLVQQMVHRFADRIIVGVDARDGWVATTGWTQTTRIQAADLIAQMATLGIQRVIYTDIARDGTLTEPNYTAIAALVRLDGPAIIASGGIAHIDHLLQLASLQVEGAIIGRALYTGAIGLSAAIDALRGGA